MNPFSAIKVFFISSIFINNLVVSWTDFSETRVIKGGLRDIMNLPAFCPVTKYLRGISLDHPTHSTIRWALQCSPLNENKEYKYMEKSFSTSGTKCDKKNQFHCLKDHPILCPPGSILKGFNIYNYDLLAVSFTCLSVHNAVCLNSNSVSSEPFYIKNNSLKSSDFKPVITENFNSAIQGFHLDIDDTTDTTHFKYSFCFFNNHEAEKEKEFDKTNVTQIVETTGVNIDFYFYLVEEKSLKFLSDFSSVSKKFKDYISFTPHYLMNTTMKNYLGKDEIEKNCINNGEFCLKPYKKRSSGYHLLLETVKQLCIFNEAQIGDRYNKDLYFEYIYTYRTDCLKDNLRADCGANLFEMYGLGKVFFSHCIQSSFSNQEEMNGENKILKKQFMISNDKNIDKISLFINGAKIEDYSISKVVDHLCKIMPKIKPCMHEEEDDQIPFAKIALYTFSAILTLLILLYLYRCFKLSVLKREHQFKLIE